MTKKERFKVYKYLLDQLKHQGNKYQCYYGFCFLLNQFELKTGIYVDHISKLTELQAFKPKTKYKHTLSNGISYYIGYWYSQSKIGNNKRIQILESILKNNKK